VFYVAAEGGALGGGSRAAPRLPSRKSSHTGMTLGGGEEGILT